MMTMAPSSSRRPPPPPPPARPQDVSLNAAADLIRTLDTAFEEMSSLSASAAKDAEDARRNARAASEVARRYTARSFPQILSPPQQQQHQPLSLTHTSPPLEQQVQKSPTSPPLSPTRKRKNPKAPVQSDRLVQSHVEDVLTLSLELERTKQELERERHEHDQTRMLYTKQRTRNQNLEDQMEKLLAEMENKREESGRKIDSLQEELMRSKVRAEAAEEDAQAALDLATESANSREQLEHWLQSSMEEVTVLREELSQYRHNGGSNGFAMTPNNKKNHVRFAESPTIVTLPSRDGRTVPPLPPSYPASPPRAMVATGRNLLAKAMTPDKVHTIVLTPQKSAERRQRLRERLKALDDEELSVVRSPPKLSSQSPRPPRTGVDMGLAKTAMETCHAVANVLRESARSQKLAGRWLVPQSLQDAVDGVEQLARRYCSEVEIKSQRHLEDVNELRALCGYLEEKVALNLNGDKEENV